MSDTFLLKKLHHLLRQEYTKRQKEEEHYLWQKWARPNQLPPPGQWRVWLILAGRGFGKTRAGAETIRKWVQEGLCRRVALIGETQKDARHVMIEGTSGLLSVHSPSERPHYEPSKHQVTWPNGAIARCFSAVAYDHLRGPQFDGAWVDELAKFKEGEKVWDQLMFSLRLGKHPRAIVTTTPRPTKLLKSLVKDPDVVVTKGTTFENANNLAKPFLDFIYQRYKSSSLGRQELYADFIDSPNGALWTPSLLESARESYKEGPLKRVVIAIDPAVSHGDQSDETGIIAAGLTNQGIGVILEDLSLKGAPTLWMERVLEAYHRLQADRVVAEVNMGGILSNNCYAAMIGLSAIKPSVQHGERFSEPNPSPLFMNAIRFGTPNTCLNSKLSSALIFLASPGNHPIGLMRWCGL